MMTEQGAQRILDYRVFGHNLRRFPSYIRECEAKRERWRDLLRNSKEDILFRGQGNHFRSMIKKIETWYGKYQGVWNEYFAIS